MAPRPMSGSQKHRGNGTHWGPLGGACVYFANEGPGEIYSKDRFISAELKVSPGYLARQPFIDRIPVNFPRMAVPWSTLWERLL